MATKYNAQMEDSEGNVYLIKPDLIDTKEALNANTTAGKAVDALVVKELNKNMGGVIITAEGSGADTKYYVQKGADTASKKTLGSGTITYLGKMPYTVDKDYGDCILLTFEHLTASASEFKITNFAGSYTLQQQIAANDGGNLNRLSIITVTGLTVGAILDTTKGTAKQVFIIQ